MLIEKCGGMRRGDKDLKIVDILISRDDGGDVNNFLLKIIDKLEDEGLLSL